MKRRKNSLSSQSKKMKTEDLIRGAIKPISKPEKVNHDQIKETKDSVEISSGVNKINWDILAKKKRFKDRPTDISKWGAPDFFRYIRDLYSNTFPTPWQHLIPGNVLTIMLLKDDLIGAIGFCDNAILWSYINFFWNGYSKKAYIKSGDFYFKQLRNKSVLKDFFKSFDYSKINNEDIEAATPVISVPDKNGVEEDMDCSFLLGVKTLLMEYGFVLSANYFIAKKKLSADGATNLVLKAAFEMKSGNHNGIDEVVAATKKYWPLPKELSVNSVEAFKTFIKQADMPVNEEVKNQFSFLKGAQVK